MKKNFYGFEIVCEIPAELTQDDLKNLIEVPEKDVLGVWALFGKEKDDDYYGQYWRCLQVGETKKVHSEICQDIKKIYREIDIYRTKKYVNYFGDELFEYDEICDGNEYAYICLREWYENFVFVLIAEEEDVRKRKKIEKCVATITESVCWRNGRSRVDNSGKVTEIVQKKISNCNFEKNNENKNIYDKILKFRKENIQAILHPMACMRKKYNSVNEYIRECEKKF